MNEIRLYGKRDLRLVTAPEARTPRAGEVRVRVTCVGICGSDLHPYLSGDIDGRGPNTGATIVPGHEFAGVVESLGEPIPHWIADVQKPVVSLLRSGDGRELKPGTRVAVNPAMSCGVCARCVEGNSNLCEKMRFCGLFPYDGALCEQITVPATCCYPLDAPAEYGEDGKNDEKRGGNEHGGLSISDEAGAMLEPMGVALHAVRLSKILPGETVAILGCGPIGLGIAKFATLAGARVVAIDRYSWRLLAAQEFANVEQTVLVKDNDSKNDDCVATVRRWVSNGVDVAIEAAWCDASVQQAAEMVRPGGRLTIAGIPAEDQLVLRHSTARRKGLTIRMVRRMKQVYPTLLDLAWRGVIEPERLISDRYSFADTAQAYADAAGYRDGVLKTLVRLN